MNTNMKYRNVLPNDIEISNAISSQKSVADGLTCVTRGETANEYNGSRKITCIRCSVLPLCLSIQRAVRALDEEKKIGFARCPSSSPCYHLINLESLPVTFTQSL